MNFNGVAISGKAGAGKSEFGLILERRLQEDGIWSAHLAFGDMVKQEVLDQYGLTKADPGGREALVAHGHGMRQVYADYWVDQLDRKYNSLTAYGITPIVTDVRYANEYDWATRSGLVIVRVDVQPMDRMVSLSSRGEKADFAFSEHPSETELDEAVFHYRFWNPHGDSFAAMYHAAVVVADMLRERAA